MLLTSIFSFSHSFFFFFFYQRDKLSFLVSFRLSSANALDLVIPEILSFGKGLKPLSQLLTNFILIIITVPHQKAILPESPSLKKSLYHIFYLWNLVLLLLINHIWDKDRLSHNRDRIIPRKMSLVKKYPVI